MISHSIWKGEHDFCDSGFLEINCDLRYTYVLLNDFFTAGNGVMMKKKLESKDLGTSQNCAL